MSRDGQPQGRPADENGAALATATRRKKATYPELLRWSPAPSGGRWGTGAFALVRDLVRIRRLRALRNAADAAATAWARRWWMSFAVQRATALSVAGRAWPAASRTSANVPALELALELADAAGPSTLHAASTVNDPRAGRSRCVRRCRTTPFGKRQKVKKK